MPRRRCVTFLPASVSLAHTQANETHDARRLVPTVTINIADRGAPLSDGGTSAAGHMWYELADNQGQLSSYGFAPDEEHHGKPFSPGQVYSNDSANYQKPAYSRTIEITQPQYDAMKSFGDNPSSAGFSTRYNGLTNSCIDFTWKALQQAGLNPSGFEGHIWPTWNERAVSMITNPQLALTQSTGPPPAASGGGIFQVCNNAQLQCSFGAAPSLLGVLPLNRMLTNNQPAGTIMDHVPMVNIRPFGVCKSIANPTVAAATAAAQGVLTPMPCVPATQTPWTPGSRTVQLGNFPTLNNTSKLMCMWAGVIQVTNPGQSNHKIP